jgi:hypothetical protein
VLFDQHNSISDKFEVLLEVCQELKDGKDDTAAASVKEEEEEDKVVSISASVSVPVDKVSHVLP